MTKRTRLLYLLPVLCLLLCACSKETASDVTEDILNISDEEKPTYTVAVVSSPDAIATNRITDGIKATLEEYYEDRITIKTDDTEDASLIFTLGAEATIRESSKTDTTPIVAAEVPDYKALLGDRYVNAEKDNTGINVTGIDCIPSFPEQLSLMIEATKNLDTVGLFYSPEDASAIMQNRKLEELLDEAGIPWKEYILPSPAYREYLSATKKQRKKEKFKGLTATINTIGAQTPLVSTSWAGGKNTPSTDPKTYVTNLPKAASAKRIIKYACMECSCLYITSHSQNSNLYKQICSLASKRSVTTLGGDITSGVYSLVSLYVPESDIGQAIAQYAIDILDNGRDPAEMDIISLSTLTPLKVYNDSLAKSFGLEFPKSFTELSEAIQ